ncbi:MFS transporter [Pseudomonas sp. RIT-PI-S]|uniref:MFS transporter n=1 Tax=Pseudomonas sp. RIT-PI-S TaxID=3035295 RepID=UPI0021DB6B11|nr:MFS transporter [Pseudomonas sp. RIT-PI-S]
MSRTLSALLLLVLTADGLLAFLVPVMVYGFTGSLAMSGLTYAMAWLPRVLVTPLVGASIDRWGVRPVSVVSDMVKLGGCLIMVAVLLNDPDPLTLTLLGGLLSGLVAIGNAQSLIAYEKMIALASKNIDRDVNILCRIDQLAMVIGPVAGLAGYATGVINLLLLTAAMYAVNGACYFFISGIPKNPPIEPASADQAYRANLRLIIATPLLLSSILLAVGNNAFDGLVEASAVALIDRAMQLPIQYFAFVDMCAGVCGVAATLLYSRLTRTVASLRLFVAAAVITASASALMIASQGYLAGFLALYALSIGAKVFMNNFSRNLRIRVVPPQRLAGVSSLMVLLNQAVLPAVGLALYMVGEHPPMVSMLMALAISVTLFAAYRIYHQVYVTELPETQSARS